MECQIGHNLPTSLRPNYILFDINELKNYIKKYINNIFFCQLYTFWCNFCEKLYQKVYISEEKLLTFLYNY
jgi:hypothetical protein